MVTTDNTASTKRPWRGSPITLHNSKPLVEDPLCIHRVYIFGYQQSFVNSKETRKHEHVKTSAIPFQSASTIPVE
jgi:hypothetical protein